MKICILGTGNYAKAIGSRIAHAGLPLVYGSRRVAPESSEESEDTCPPDSSASTALHGDGSSPNASKRPRKVEKIYQPGELIIKAPCDAVKGADIVIMAIPISGHAEMVSLIQPYLTSDAVIIDVSNTTFSKSAAKRHAEQMEASISAMATTYEPRTNKDARRFAKIVRRQRKVQKAIDKLIAQDENGQSRFEPHADSHPSRSPYSSLDLSRPSPYSLDTTLSGLPKIGVDMPTSPLSSMKYSIQTSETSSEQEAKHKENCADPCCNPDEESQSDETVALLKESRKSKTEGQLLLHHRTRSSASITAVSHPSPSSNVADIENLHNHPKIANRHRGGAQQTNVSSIQPFGFLSMDKKGIAANYTRGCPTHGLNASCDACSGAHLGLGIGNTSINGNYASINGDSTALDMQPCPAPWNLDCWAVMSNAEHLQRLLPYHTVVKAFNTISAYALLAGPGAVQEDRVLVCSDQQWAKDRVFTLISTMGMRPVDAGPLMSAREVEKKSVVFFEDWRAAVWISAALFLIAAIYIAVRDIALVKGHWPDLLLLKFNVIIAWHSLALFTATFLAGAVAALRQLTTGTAKVAFPTWLDKWLKARKSLGLMALASAAIHMVAALMTDHLFVDFGYVRTVQGSLYQGSIFSALLSIVVYSALGATSIPSVGSNLSWREWTFVQSKLGIVGLALGALHAGLMVFALGDLPKITGWPYYLPPAGLIVTCAAILLLLIRVILAIPFISKRLDRIRGGG